MEAVSEVVYSAPALGLLEGQSDIEGNDVANFTPNIVVAGIGVVLTIVVGIQGWMLRQIIDLGKWRAATEERCKQHGLREKNLEQEVPVALKMLENQGSELHEMRVSITKLVEQIRLTQRETNERFDRFEKRWEVLMKDRINQGDGHE